ncbi:hypothetical protein [Shewanella pneumatophori]|uniref:D-serine dehydratase n=1 Tax=Shewanella pneumatophori TaxID=314092 RepID=A0A9X2CGN3_9GAMM|nr:hypothetical protein [Shewanella pneumatophori]MCL1137600.1 hypothetical protein [Shewanella pneumatophori]
MAQSEAIEFEPSALAGMPGALRVSRDTQYQVRMGLTSDMMANATHVVWATGGGMVPAAEMAKYLVQSAS